MSNWFKGNTHTHTLNSDGDSSPGEVAHWYRDHGYHFLVLSDHNFLTSVEELQRELDREGERLASGRLLLIPGEEVTDVFQDGQHRREVHVNGLDTTRRVGPQGGESVREVLQRCVDAVHEAGGVATANHPNFRWSLTVDDLASIEGLRYLEIYNGHPQVHNLGGGGSPGTEEMWDGLLSRGLRLWGMGVDDAHHFKAWGPHLSNPGRGWVMVRADQLTGAAIVAAIEAGDFYISTGVGLEHLSTEGGIEVRIAPLGDFRFQTQFVGQDGKVLAEADSLEASYRLRTHGYVRARIRSSGGAMAWTQPVFS
ncbi:MAG: CehA/McbA family metallohydrolase [Acidimicrobiia bacterium]